MFTIKFSCIQMHALQDRDNTNGFKQAAPEGTRGGRSVEAETWKEHTISIICILDSQFSHTNTGCLLNRHFNGQTFHPPLQHNTHALESWSNTQKQPYVQ